MNDVFVFEINFEANYNYEVRVSEIKFRVKKIKKTHLTSFGDFKICKILKSHKATKHNCPFVSLCLRVRVTKSNFYSDLKFFSI
ncbi:MAG: hypothetical protein CVT88_00890 [Candidatus Altiarchaeales archaeon HGW-Altiarchaeales-1]|nr:MAG: hypothetical protein CVT88_00890 [Candidatus Altiarchaeales archaeon HGW-Altiarchaeales-1]